MQKEITAELMLPAHAGMTPRKQQRLTHTQNAPRACGDDPPHTEASKANRPNAPRACGDDPIDEEVANTARGCSPRMRG